MAKKTKHAAKAAPAPEPEAPAPPPPDPLAAAKVTVRQALWEGANPRGFTGENQDAYRELHAAGEV